MFVSYFEPEKMSPGRGESHDVCISRNNDSQARKLIFFFFFSNDEDHGPRKIDLQIKVMAGFSILNSTIGTCLAGHHIADPIQVDIVQY